MAKKKGLITKEEVAENREKAINVAKGIKERFKALVPHRIDHVTVVYLRSDQDKQEQIDRFMRRLNKDRLNYG